MKLRIKRLTKIALCGSVLFSFVGCSWLKNPTSASSGDNLAANNPLFSPDNLVTAQNFKLKTVLEGLEHPWSIAWIPDGSMLITERPGRLRIARNGVLNSQAISGVPEVLAGGQAGLMDVALHPDFSSNRLVYLTYAHGNRSANQTRIARAEFDGAALNNLEVIFEVNPVKNGRQHFGSRIVWLPDKTMLVSIGDGGNPPIQLDGNLIRRQAQNLSVPLGKVIRLNDDGSIPADNPSFDSAATEPAVWSYGHRNIQGLAFDSSRNRLWATEHGSKGGDELNLLAAGKNYGWPEVTYSEEYTGGQISAERSRPGMIDPKVVWTPAIAPSGLAVYTGDLFSQWQGDLFAGGLVSRDVRRLDLDEEGNILQEESIYIGQRVRDVRQSPSGMLYVLTDEANGQLLQIEAEDF
ncbi:MAG: PQQ-dependent sugar dehydrogenase [Cyanobacteria bacterium P01_C01_bin.72]